MGEERSELYPRRHEHIAVASFAKASSWRLERSHCIPHNGCKKSDVLLSFLPRKQCGCTEDVDAEFLVRTTFLLVPNDSASHEESYFFQWCVTSLLSSYPSSLAVRIIDLSKLKNSLQRLLQNSRLRYAKCRRRAELRSRRNP